ncbi:hypothetical protein [Amycolatopsis sp. NPDC049868]|uniref:terpene synthase family protein n=1 Tax=Amycolatopsis sp. NPDC049868 TaxID=3363934 RepID=UPI0037B4F3CA
MSHVSELHPLWQHESEEVQALMPWARARLDALFPQSPDVPEEDPFDKEVYDCALNIGIYSGSTRQELSALECGRAVRLCAPCSGPNLWLPLAMLFAFVTAVDDGVAEQGDPLREISSTANRILRRRHCPGDDDSATARCLSIVREQTEKLGATACLPLLADRTVASLRGMARQQQYLRDDRLPDPAAYLSLRQDAMSIGPMIALHQWVAGGPVGQGSAGLLLRDTAALVALISGLDNDILGVPKDLACTNRFDLCNYVFVLAHHQNVPLVTAIRSAVAVVEAYVYRLDSLVEEIERTEPLFSPLRRQMRATAGWASGLHVWFRTARRYTEADKVNTSHGAQSL